ncbi:DUF935 domain-containing protein [Varunaivibrio sulfuroxidans]|nr:DUF935 domain-containing protein [Varunaivibrio sulfuroxidans]WES30755.1 DUF935 domain-containing protein [Varunaivibrio sulfuroxidans]
MLTDQWGRPMKKSDLARELSAPTLKGVRGLQGGHPAQGLTPGRLAAILREAETGDATRYLEMAEEIEEKDLHYLGVLGTRKRQVAQLELTVIPGGDTQDDLDNADLIRGWLDREELEDELFDILDSVGKGYSVAEIMWDTSGGQWTPTRLIWRDPRWFRFDPMDGVTLRLIGAGGALEPLAAYKFIRHRTKAKSGLPIRGGLARAAAWGYLFKNFDVRDWVIFAERFGHPLRVGRYGAHATKEEKEVLLSAVANIASDAACIIPQGMELEFIEAKITGNVDMFEKFADWIDRQISKAVLGQTLTTEVKGGSLAAARVHGGVKDDIERADAKELSATLNRDLVRPMIDLNKGPQKRYPKIRIGRADETDLAQMTDSLAKLVPVGLKVSAKQVRDKLGLSAPTAPTTCSPRPPPPRHPPRRPGRPCPPGRGPSPWAKPPATSTLPRRPRRPRRHRNLHRRAGRRRRLGGGDRRYHRPADRSRRKREKLRRPDRHPGPGAGRHGRRRTRRKAGPRHLPGPPRGRRGRRPKGQKWRKLNSKTCPRRRRSPILSARAMPSASLGRMS